MFQLEIKAIKKMLVQNPLFGFFALCIAERYSCWINGETRVIRDCTS